MMYRDAMSLRMLLQVVQCCFQGHTKPNFLYNYDRLVKFSLKINSNDNELTSPSNGKLTKSGVCRYKTRVKPLSQLNAESKRFTSILLCSLLMEFSLSFSLSKKMEPNECSLFIARHANCASPESQKLLKSFASANNKKKAICNMANLPK